MNSTHSTCPTTAALMREVSTKMRRYRIRLHPRRLKMADEFLFADPHKGHELALATVETDRLEVITHQRKPSPSHIKHVAASIERLGFVVPLVVVRQERDGEERYVVIDGQHR